MIGWSSSRWWTRTSVVPAWVLDLEAHRGPDRGRREGRLLGPVVAEREGGRGADHDRVARLAVGEHVLDLLAEPAGRHRVQGAGPGGREEQGAGADHDHDPQRHRRQAPGAPDRHRGDPEGAADGQQGGEEQAGPHLQERVAVERPGDHQLGREQADGHHDHRLAGPPERHQPAGDDGPGQRPGPEPDPVQGLGGAGGQERGRRPRAVAQGDEVGGPDAVHGRVVAAGGEGQVDGRLDAGHAEAEGEEPGQPVPAALGQGLERERSQHRHRDEHRHVADQHGRYAGQAEPDQEATAPAGREPGAEPQQQEGDEGVGGVLLEAGIDQRARGEGDGQASRHRPGPPQPPAEQVRGHHGGRGEGQRQHPEPLGRSDVGNQPQQEGPADRGGRAEQAELAQGGPDGVGHPGLVQPEGVGEQVAGPAGQDRHHQERDDQAGVDPAPGPALPPRPVPRPPAPAPGRGRAARRGGSIQRRSLALDRQSRTFHRSTQHQAGF